MPTLVNNLRAIRGPITSVPISGVSGIIIEPDVEHNQVLIYPDASNVIAGNGINITQSGNNTTISLGVTAGITDIQLVNSLPASPTSTVLYLIPET